MNINKKIKVGFLGVGWIGRNRMESLLKSNLAEAVAISDVSEDNAKKALEIAPGAKIVNSIEQLIEEDIEAIVIATPSGQHYEQVITALNNDLHVFCQKPLARTKEENRHIVNKAKIKNKVLWVDMSYRYTDAMQKIKSLVDQKMIGNVYAIDAVFHNAYGPDKAWFYDPKQSGGGCVIDLGIHLIDLALWISDFPKIDSIKSSLYSKGKRIIKVNENVEDFATSSMNFTNGVNVNIACSWNLSAGCDAVINFTIYGTEGGLSMRNHNGSFYKFDTYHFKSCDVNTICNEEGLWSGKAITDWVKMVVCSAKFDNRAEQFIQVADVIDLIYERD